MKYYFNIGIFLILFVSFANCKAEETINNFGESSSLKQKLISSLSQLKENNQIFGGWSDCPEGRWGMFRINSAKLDTTYIKKLTGDYIIAADSINGIVTLVLFGDTVNLHLHSKISPVLWTGEGEIRGKSINAGFMIFSELDNEGNYDLNMEVKLKKMKLGGAIENLQSHKDIILRYLKTLFVTVGFEGFNLSIVGDSCIDYQSPELECRASINLQSQNPGEKTGMIWINNGKIWKLGREFVINKTNYSFETAEIFAQASYATKVFVTLEDSGSILREYTVYLNYNGIVPDLVNWDYTVSPELDSTQIYALLIKGDPFAPEIAGFIVTNIEERIKQATQNYNPQRFNTYTERQVGRLLTFDRVNIEGNIFSIGSQYEAQKELSGRLRLSLRGTVGGTAEQRVSFDYNLGHNLYIISETNQFGRTGVDLRYVIKFR